jgi:hypothetical protein
VRSYATRFPTVHLQQQQQERTGEQAQQTQAGREFGSPEEMLRHDRAATPLPEAVASRLKQTLAAEPPPRPWWKRILGK